MADEMVLRAAEEFVETAKRYDLARVPRVGELFEAIEIAVSRVSGSSTTRLAHMEELRLIREIHLACVRPIAEELRRRAMAVVFARGAWNFEKTVDHLAQLILADAVPAPDEESHSV